jgi:putative transposase
MAFQMAYKFKLEPSTKQKEYLFRWLSSLRYLYNSALEHRIRNYQQFRKSMNYYDQANELTEAKSESPWLADVPSQALQQKLKDLDSAFQKFFKGGGFPKFRKRSDTMSMRFPDGKSIKVDYRKGKRTSFVKLPKIGVVKFVSSRPIEGTIKNATITLATDGHYISFQVEKELALAPNNKSAVGIDRGVNTLGVTSEGEFLELPNERIKTLEKKLSKEQRLLARKSKGSKRRELQRKRVALVHAKIARIRKDCLNKITTQLANSHGKIVLEDLKIKNMSASASGTLEEPGKMVAQKRGLNRAILRQGWHEFERQLAYKIAWQGGTLVKVHAAYTSQACNKCGYVHSENRNKQDFNCVSCGYHDHADINAAKNILTAGHAVRGEVNAVVLVKTKTRRTSLKRKPIAA